MRKGFQILVVVALVMVMCGANVKVAQAGFFDKLTNSKETTTSTADGKCDANDASIMVNNELVTLGMDINTVLKKLGPTTDYSEAKSCIGDGMSKVFTWNGIAVTTYGSGKKDVVYLIEVTGTEVTTSGIKVGDAVSNIEKAYGKTYEDDGTYLTYQMDEFSTLSFKMNNGKIELIEFYTEPQ